MERPALPAYSPYRSLWERVFWAQVLLPWDPATMAFYELQALNVPVAIPEPPLLLRIHRAVGWIYTEPIGESVFAGANLTTHPHQPWWRPDYTLLIY